MYQKKNKPLPSMKLNTRLRHPVPLPVAASSVAQSSVVHETLKPTFPSRKRADRADDTTADDTTTPTTPTKPWYGKVWDFMVLHFLMFLKSWAGFLYLNNTVFIKVDVIVFMFSAFTHILALITKLSFMEDMGDLSLRIGILCAMVPSLVNIISALFMLPLTYFVVRKAGIVSFWKDLVDSSFNYWALLRELKQEIEDSITESAADKATVKLPRFATRSIPPRPREVPHYYAKRSRNQYRLSKKSFIENIL